MTELKEFKLPDAGEGLTEADIVAWHVKPGDQVEDGQIIVEVETAKAVVELPSPWDGTVARLLAEEGETVEVGVPIIAIEVAGAAARVEPAVAASGQEKADHAERAGVPAPAPADSPGTDKPERQAVLVGYGVKASSTTRRARKTSQPVAAAAARPETAEVPTGPAEPAEPLELPAEPGAPAVRALAKPPVRKLAKDLGISLAELAGSGPDGSITRDDVQRAAATGTPVRSGYSVVENGARAGHLTTAASPRGEERIPVRGVRKHMAAAMVSSAFTAPHVTEFLQVDVTETMAAVRRVRELPEFAGAAGIAAALRGPGAAHRGGQAPAHQLVLGRRRGGDRGQALREPRHRGGRRPRPHRAEHQERGRAAAARTGPQPAGAGRDRAGGQGHPGRSGGRHDHDHQRRGVRGGRGHSRSSPPARRPSSRSGRSKTRPGWSTGSSRCARPAPCRCPSTIASWTANSVPPSCATSARCSRTRFGCSPGLC